MKPTGIEHAIIHHKKLVDYLLSSTHPEGRGKAAFFRRVGFSSEMWEELAAALRQLATEHEIMREEPTPFGTRYVIEGTMATPSSRTPYIRTVWFIERDEDVPQLVTAYPIDPR